MSRIIFIFLFTTITLIHESRASFCGEAAVPFSFEALPNGQPVLGCARPTCFGWTPEGSPAGSAASFYRVNRRADGYFRKSVETPRAIASVDAASFKPQTAHCAATFDSEQCPSESQWIGGFGPVMNASQLPLAVQCCDYKPLALSEDRGVAVVNSGQIVIGGEISSNERQYAFDYISDVVKHTDPSGNVTYDVSIRRLPCLPYPPEFTVKVDDSVKEEVLKRFSKAIRAQTTTKSQKARAHQSPTLNFADNEFANPAPNLLQTNFNAPPPSGQVIEGPFIAENEPIVETVNSLPPGEQAIQGLELPQGQAPQGVVNQNSQYYPVNSQCGGSGGGGYFSGGGGGAGCGFFCFSADTVVRTSSGKVKRMDEVTVNDWVLSAGSAGKMVFSRVESWIHKMPEKLADFIKFTLEDGKTLKITSKHFIFKGACQNVGEIVPIDVASEDMVYAEEVEVEDCLFVHENNKLVEKRVVLKELVQEKGIYAPMTSTSNIIVNDVHASCFNIIKNKEVQTSFAENLRWWASSLVGRFLAGSSTEEENDSEIELLPGMQTLVELMMHVVPNKF